MWILQNRAVLCLLCVFLCCFGNLLLAELPESLVAYYKLNETSGLTAADETGNYPGTLTGDMSWVPGKQGNALEFTGGNGGPFVNLDAWQTTGPDGLGLAIWVNWNGTEGTYQGLMSQRQGTMYWWLELNPDGSQLRFKSNTTPQSNLFLTGEHLIEGEWVHVAFSHDAAAATGVIYLNAEERLAGDWSLPSGDFSNVTSGIGVVNTADGLGIFNGILDEAMIFQGPFSATEVKAIMEGSFKPKATAPRPAPEQVDVPRDVTLTWTPAPSALRRNVYLGMSYEDVNAASAELPLDTMLGLDLEDNTFDPGVLAFNQTYYWRVDEVNQAPDNTVFRGDIWSFTVEPVAYPIANVTATASSTHQDGMGPENTVNGSGLNELDEHSVSATDMWLSGMGDAQPSIQYEFDRVYKLYELWVWNSNQMIESFIGLGAKDVVVEYSTDGTEWTVVEGATLLNQATGTSSYTANTVVDLAGALAKSVRITIASGYGMMPQYGLSEVRFFFIPTLPREPQPTDGDIMDSADVMLSWRAGREAVSHEVYLGTDPAALLLVATTSKAAYAANSLAYDTTYYWRVDEVNENEAVSTYAGDLWSFTTPPFGTVDDFDQYDDFCHRIFFAWADGLGHTGGTEVEDCDVLPSNGNGGGSIVGNEVAPFAEKTIVNAGSSQAMPFNYDNAFGASETMLTLSGQDWSASGVQTLSIAFAGTAGNTGTLYIKINNTKIVYDQDPADIARSAWQAWNIDLTSVSGVQNVTRLTIGVDGATASGMLYIDDIRLYPLAGELITPVDPGTTNLAGAWGFNEGSGAVAADDSGNGNAGTIAGNAAGAWAPGQQGNALSAGNGVYVSVPAAAWSSVSTQFTVSFWAQGNEILGNNWGFYAGDASGRLAACHIPWGNQIIFDTTAAWSSERVIRDAAQSEIIGQWRHWTFMKNADTGEKKIYLDGRLYASGTGSATPIADVDRFFIGAGDDGVAGYIGLIDEFKLFDAALTDGEILWLAGGTSPIHKAL